MTKCKCVCLCLLSLIAPFNMRMQTGEGVSELYFVFLFETKLYLSSLPPPPFPFPFPLFSLCLSFPQVFVFLVVILTSSILLIAYLILIPMVLTTYSPPWIAWHICYGHWNLVMIVFHYYKATKTAPGYPPTVRNQSIFRPVISLNSCKTFHAEKGFLSYKII